VFPGPGVFVSSWGEGWRTIASTDESLQRLRSAWKYATGEAREAFGREVVRELFGPAHEGSLIVAQAMVSARTGEPLVMLTWGEQACQVTPEEARQHAMMVLEAAASAETDSFLFSFLVNRIETDRDWAGQLLLEFRAWRQRRAELPEDPEGFTG
jgi:hypothetical protein